MKWGEKMGWNNHIQHSRKEFKNGLTVAELIEQLQMLDGTMKVNVWDMANGHCEVSRLDTLSRKYSDNKEKFLSLW